MKTTPERIWGLLRSRKAGSKVKAKTLFDNLPNSTAKAISIAISRMKRDGALMPTDKRGIYYVTPKMKEWGTNIKFRGTVKKLARKVRIPAIAPSRHPNRIIDNLLNAMAEAESELVRLMELDDKVKQL